MKPACLHSFRAIQLMGKLTEPSLYLTVFIVLRGFVEKRKTKQAYVKESHLYNPLYTFLVWKKILKVFVM